MPSSSPTVMSCEITRHGYGESLGTGRRVKTGKLPKYAGNWLVTAASARSAVRIGSDRSGALIRARHPVSQSQSTEAGCAHWPDQPLAPGALGATAGHPCRFECESYHP